MSNTHEVKPDTPAAAPAVVPAPATPVVEQVAKPAAPAAVEPKKA